MKLSPEMLRHQLVELITAGYSKSFIYKYFTKAGLDEEEITFLLIRHGVSLNVIPPDRNIGFPTLGDAD